MPGIIEENSTNGEIAVVTKQLNGSHAANGLEPKEVNGTSETKEVNGNDKVAGESSTDTDSEKKDDEKEQEEKSEPEKQKCEVSAYEARYDMKGERELVCMDAKKANKEDADSDDEKKKYALCSYKWYSRNGEIEEASVEIMSPYIIFALQKVVNEFPDEHFWSDTVTIQSPYRPVFHYREELAKYADEAEDEDVKAHVRLLLTFMEKELRRALSQYTANVQNALDKPSISYSNLWMIYKPGELFFTGGGASLKCMQVVDSYEQTGNCAAYIVVGKTFTHDGERYGYEEHRVRQAPYKGMKPLAKLRCVAHDYFEEAETAKETLIARGRKFCSLKGSHYKTYAGTASALANVRDWNSYGEYKQEPMIISSRVMIDTKMFGIMKSPNRISLDDYKAMPMDVSEEEEKEYIDNRDLLLADHKIPGYALQAKRWCWFNVDLINPIVFNTEAFDSLLLPAKQKSLVHSLVKIHASGNDEFDDMIAGKGKGLVFVLHGCPGVGKTFTAESVADHIQRPLYVLNSGELGIEPTEVEGNLSKALMLAVAWNAILLIDEADVFLEQRSLHDLQRNTLVSLFLQTLEYYEGILFLTTNRITSFDPAFKSRVHLALKYHALTAAARKELWKTFISRTSKTAPVFDDEALERLAAVDVNGRQIKNAVRTANALARDEGRTLCEEHLQSVLETIADFEADLGEKDEFAR
ncbi:hypothetical protein H2198_008386 [Neophaeococcomyces mojaviensis]|uniref:Uncharacterized protein n=1 Tax=Neophaeococcomyces mojaviensis TaxID=3383035 RepID=A0ACC2ZXG9_9EURO|nr:hypothetical protein H2198_008386 [Knufia sp. JES_112]